MPAKTLRSWGSSPLNWIGHLDRVKRIGRSGIGATAGQEANIAGA